MENSNSSAPENSGTGTPGAPLIEQVKQQTQQVVGQAGEKAGQVVGQVRNQVKTQLSDKKVEAAGGLGTVAQALRQTGETLRTGQQEGVAQAADTAAQFVDQVSGYLRDKDIDDLVGEVENFARTNPAVFLGSAFVLGFMAARFLKSSTPSPALPEGSYGNGGYAGASSAYESYDALVPADTPPVTARSGEDLDLIPDQFSSGTTGGAAVGLGASGSTGTYPDVGISSGLDVDTDAGLGTGTGLSGGTGLGSGLGTGMDLDADTDVDTDPDVITRSDDR